MAYTYASATTGNDTIYIDNVDGLKKPAGGTITAPTIYNVDGLAGTDNFILKQAQGLFNNSFYSTSFTITPVTATTNQFTVSGASKGGGFYTFNLSNVEQISFSDTTVTLSTGPVAGDKEPPAFASASMSVGSAVLNLLYTDNLNNLDSVNKPLPSAFSVTVNGTATAVNSVSISGKTVSLTLAHTAVANDAVTFSYNAPALTVTTAIQDAVGNHAISELFPPLTISADNTPPVLYPASTSLPAGETITGMHPVADNIFIKFKENIALNTADATAAIELHQGSVTGAVVAKFLTNSTDLSYTGDTLAIHHTNPLSYGSQYAVTFSTLSATTRVNDGNTSTTYNYGNSAITDLAGNIMYSAGTATNLANLQSAGVTPFTFSTVADPFVAHHSTVVDSGPVLVGAGGAGILAWMFFI